MLMPLATLLLVAGYSTRNPTAVGMERRVDADDPAPGILRVTRHPVMWAIGLWGLSHLIANEDLASLWFFGAIAALALGGTVLIDRKKRLALGSNWRRLASITSNVPFAALAGRRSRLRWRDIGLLRPLAALLLYAVLYLAHPLFAGVPIVFPWPAGGQGETAMLLPLARRRLYYDLTGPEDGPVVCITHSLSSDGGSWAEQVPALLQVRFSGLASRHARAWRQRRGRRQLHDERTRRRCGERARRPRLRPGALHRAVDRRHDRPGLRLGARS